MSATVKLNSDNATLVSAVNFASRRPPRTQAWSVSKSNRASAHERNHFATLRLALALERDNIRGNGQTDNLVMATATRQMRDRVERVMREGMQCDCCSAEMKDLFQEWIDNRENTLRTKEITDKQHKYPYPTSKNYTLLPFNIWGKRKILNGNMMIAILGSTK